MPEVGDDDLVFCGPRGYPKADRRFRRSRPRERDLGGELGHRV
jgi:hypothetical protein